MSPRLRALVGAAVGALLVLALHPATRPALFAAFRPNPPDRLQSLLARPPLAPPTDADSGAAYLHAGAERRASGRALTQDETRTMLEIASRGEAREPDNPFWPLASFYFQRGEGRAARDAWRRASRCKRYYDHQRRTLLADRDRLAAEVGDVQAWIYATIATRRSEAMIVGIRDVAVQTFGKIKTEPERTDFAYEMIRNGALIRDGSERLDLGEIGKKMIEAATYPPKTFQFSQGSEIRRLYVAKTRFTRQLSKTHGPADARFCDLQFRTNDSWQAFRDVVDTDQRFNLLAIGAVQADALPGGLLAVCFAGGLIWAFGARVGRLATQDHRFRGPGLGACAFTLLTTGLFLGYPWVGLAAGACALVPAVRVDRPRRFDGASLGPLHVLVVGLMACLIATGVALAAVARTLPGTILDEMGAEGMLLGDFGRWATLALIVLGASALAPPAWAVVRRLPTPALTAHTYVMLGRSLTLVCLGLAVLASPLSLALDRWFGNSLAEIALNEQNAYSPSSGGER